MQSLHNYKPRYQDVEAQKYNGATYTPELLAKFVAEQMLKIFLCPEQSKIRILDPAIGDGALLIALLELLPSKLHKRVEILGFDTDILAINIAKQKLKALFPSISFHFKQIDFLSYLLNFDKNSEQFDLVIANPPYVRTQIIGTAQAQILAKRFGLTGRVDLYYPFLLGIAQVLSPDGIAGIITSNRFMTTKSGQAVRSALLSNFRIIQAWDMGDSKLFDAAVLPAVLLAKGITNESPHHISTIAYSSIYQTTAKPDILATDPLKAFSAKNNKIVALNDGRSFQIKHGVLDNGGNPKGVWRIATQATDDWLTTVESHTWATFNRIGKIRVGVKTTADKVFIHDNWTDLGNGKPELLRPLITHHCARRFKAEKPKKEILYPHEVIANKRKAVDLIDYPKSVFYLEKHRTQLESRSYLNKANRNWYEIWVPHNPNDWVHLKLVFRDISEKPTFWIDKEGAVVNGDCYWLKCEENANPDWLWLALAVANSTFIEAFYDHRFNNKLYAGRRRFITQYVELFPLPNPESIEAQEIIQLAKRIYEITPSTESNKLEMKLNAMVWKIFGLVEKVTR